MDLPRPLRASAASAALLGLALTTACGGGGTGGGASDRDADPKAEVSITVGDLPPTDQAEKRKLFLSHVEQFEKANPNITVKPKETVWQQETFSAMLAGGTMPTVMKVPYTEPQSLIARGQIADVNREFKQIKDFSSIRPSLLRNVRDKDGRTFGVPVEAYTLALVYNRELFRKAGLDPDRPPRTWDEVRTAARALNKRTGQPGFLQMTNDNTGGWMFSALTYSFGGLVQKPDGDRQRAAVDSPQARQALELLRTMRFKDRSMGSEVLLNQTRLQEKFAAGQVGMYIDGGDAYKPMVANLDLDPKTYGVTALPQQGGEHGTLGGGAVAVVRPDASPEERLAALKWIDFHELRRWFHRDAAVAEAKAEAADGQAVGGPKMPVPDSAQGEKYLEWIKPYINSPRENFTPYLSTLDKLPIIPEPQNKTQETYAVLDTVVQAVLTRKDADVDALLKDAQSKIDNLLQAG